MERPSKLPLLLLAATLLLLASHADGQPTTLSPKRPEKISTGGDALPATEPGVATPGLQDTATSSLPVSGDPTVLGSVPLNATVQGMGVVGQVASVWGRLAVPCWLHVCCC